MRKVQVLYVSCLHDPYTDSIRHTNLRVLRYGESQTFLLKPCVKGCTKNTNGVTNADGTKTLLFDQCIRCRTADVKDSGNIVDAIGF